MIPVVGAARVVGMAGRVMGGGGGGGARAGSTGGFRVVAGLEINPNLGRELQARGDLLERFATAVARATVREVRWRLGRRTPVLTGRARGNWRVGINEVDTHVNWYFFDPTGEEGMAEADEVIRNVVMGDIVYITNALPYIPALERGWSKKAPNGMIRVTAVEVPMIARAAVAKMADSLHGRAVVMGFPDRI